MSEAEQQTIIERARVIDTVFVSQQGTGQPTQVKQTIPIGIVAGESRELHPQHDADVSQSDLRGELGEARSIEEAAGRYALVFADHDDLCFCPPECYPVTNQI